MNTTKQERVDIVNDITKKISQTKRGFFKGKNGRVGKIILKNNRLWWVDEYKGKEIYFHQASSHGFPGFSNGGTLKGLVFGEFKRFILEGPVDGEYSGLNAWHWGIPEDEIKELLTYAKEKGYLK